MWCRSGTSSSCTTSSFGRLAYDYVSGISPAFAVLATLALRHEVEAALDAGSGCGVHAVRAARHSARVVATDLNPRAVRLTALSAGLSGVEVDAREGDLLEPVGETAFDLILANPPFVISPERAHLFRDGDRAGDEISKAVVEQAAALLREGGFAQIMVNWVSAPDDWSARPRDWVAGIAAATPGSFASIAERWEDTGTVVSLPAGPARFRLRRSRRPLARVLPQ